MYLGYTCSETGEVLRGLRDKLRMSPLHLAAATNNLDLAEQALTMNPSSLDKVVCGYGTALHHAVRNRSTVVVRFLLLKGANRHIETEEWKTPLLVCLSATNAEYVDGHHVRGLPAVNLDILAMLLDPQVDANGSPPDECFIWNGVRGLHFAATLGSADIVRVILDSGVDINSVDNVQNTALPSAVLACKEGDSTEVIELLLSRGIAVNARDLGCVTALFLTQCEAVAKLLLAHGASVEAVDHQKGTVLHFLVQSWNLVDLSMAAVIQVMLNAPGLDMGAKDRYGWTAIDYAKCGKRQKLMEMIKSAVKE